MGTSERAAAVREKQLGLAGEKSAGAIHLLSRGSKRALSLRTRVQKGSLCRFLGKNWEIYVRQDGNVRQNLVAGT